jgi:hypothetical protein
MRLYPTILSMKEIRRPKKSTVTKRPKSPKSKLRRNIRVDTPTVGTSSGSSKQSDDSDFEQLLDEIDSQEKDATSKFTIRQLLLESNEIQHFTEFLHVSSDNRPLWKSIIREQSPAVVNQSLLIRDSSVEMKKLKRFYSSLRDDIKCEIESNEHVWVLVISNEFKTNPELEILEILSKKYSFRVLALSAPYKANIYRMLVAIAERKEQIMWGKGNNSANNNGNESVASESERKASTKKAPEIKKPIPTKSRVVKKASVVNVGASKKKSGSKSTKKNRTVQEGSKEKNEFKLLHSDKFISSHSIEINNGMSRAVDSKILNYPESVKSDDSDVSSVFEMGYES